MELRRLTTLVFLGLCLLALLDSTITIHTTKSTFTMNPFTILGWLILAFIALFIASKIVAAFIVVGDALVQGFKAVSWRKTARIGDKAKFRNAANSWTCGEITSFQDLDGVRHASLFYRRSCSSGTAQVPLDELFPDNE